MKFCIVTRSDLIPTNHGAAVKIMETANSFVQLGHECVVVTSDRDGYSSMNLEGVFSKKSYPKRYRAMEEWPFIRGGEQRAEWFCRWVGYPVEEYFLYSAQFDPAWLIRLVSVGLVEQIDIFQAEFPGYGAMAFLASRIVSKLRDTEVRSSIVQHNVEWARLAAYGHKTSRIQRMEKVSLNLVDDVIAVSLDDKHKMIEMGVQGSKITIIPHGVSDERIQNAKSRRSHWRKKWKVSDKCVVFFHGTLHYAPNTDAVRFIAEELVPRLCMVSDLDNVHFVIAGMNPPRYFEHSRITFTDAVEDLAGHLQMADVFLCPLFDGGGTRLKLLEYLAVGKPILTTRKGAEGIPDTGQFTYVETASEMLSALSEVLCSDNHIEFEDAQNKRISMARRLNWDTVGQCYVDLYQSPEKNRGKDFFTELLSRKNKKSGTLARRQSFQNTLIESEYLPNYKPIKDKTLLLLINRGCNLTCSFCDLWDNPINMDVEKLWPVLDDAVKIGTKVLVITGGEPLLHPDLDRVIQGATKRGLSVNITTNGLLLKRHWAWIQKSGIASLSFSLDGIGDVHDTLRGQEGAFDRTVKAIGIVRSESSIPCSVYCTVTNKNVHQLFELYQLCTRLGVDFDFWPVNDAPDLYLKTEEEHALWKKQVDSIVLDNVKYAQRRSFYDDALRYHMGLSLENIRCLGFVEQYGITYTGDFLPCCVWGGKGLVQGNVFEAGLEKLWNSDTIHNCRKDMVESGCSVGCFNHSLYEYRNATQILTD